MLLRWLLKVYAVYIGLFTLVLIKSGMFFGIAIILAAVFFKELDEWQGRVLLPPYLRRFSAAERRLIEARYHLPTRLALLALGLVWTTQGLLAGPTIPWWQVPANLRLILLTWFSVGIIYLTTNELVQSHLAARAETFEHYRMDATQTSRWLFGLFFVLAAFLSHSLLS